MIHEPTRGCRRFAALLLAVVALSAVDVRVLAQDGSPARGALPAASTAWSDVYEDERSLVEDMLASESWPFRALGLMRLAAYHGPAIDAFMQRAATDRAWQVRCFALELAAERHIELDTSFLHDEIQPRVIRTALREGYAIAPERVTIAATRLMKRRNLDDLLLGIEIAAVSGDDALLADAQPRITNVLKRMDRATCARIAPRLAVLLNVQPVPVTLAQWHDWLRARDGTVSLDPSSLQRARAVLNVPDDSPIVALNFEAFSGLEEYLSVLVARDLELVVVIDSTASMQPMIHEAAAGVENVILYLRDISRSMRLAIVAYKDEDNPPVWTGHPFTDDVQSIQDFLFNLHITGGADRPEAVFEGLQACRELRSKRGATTQIVLVGDAPPHEEDEYNVGELLRTYRSRGVITHTVFVPLRFDADGLHPGNNSQWLADYNTATRETFREIAQIGGGYHVQLDAPQELVPSVVHFTLEEGWWPVFDAFYARYLKVCR
jgi:hypothetical protein